jgi:hypothetical protein
MAENSDKKTDVESLKSEELEKIPLLPRSAWNSQLTYLKVLLKAKQILDKS